MIHHLNSSTSEPIHRLYHISDLHIRCDKRHNEYKEVFNKFLNEITSENSAVVITGDLLNTKNRITSLEVILAREFLFEISRKCPLIIIPGINDKYENIKAIISNGGSCIKNINHLTEKGSYVLNNINFTYFTDNIKHDFKDVPENEYNIGLYHGIVEKCDLYNGKHASSKEMLISTFKEFDYTLLGGVHKTQFVDPKKKIAYAGSMIQKDYNEDWGDHGYILWDLQNSKVEHNTIDNNYRFVNFKILDGKLMTPLIDLPQNLYVKWDITESGSGMENVINQIQNDVRKDYNVEEETYVHSSFSPDIPESCDSKYVFDLNINKQKEYALSWLTSEGKILNEEEQKDLNVLIQHYNKKVTAKEVPYIKWKLLDLEFENILCYSEKQKIVFDNLKGIQGIIAQNNAGKSAIFDILVFSLFGKSTRTDTYSYNDLMYSSNSEEKQNIFCLLRFEDVNTKDIYNIKRETNGKSIKVTIEKNGLIIHDGSTRDANNYVTSLLGTYDDFMTITFMAQNSVHNFLMMSGKNQKEFTSRIFQLDLYDKFHKLSKNDLKKVKNKIKSLNEKLNSVDKQTIVSKVSEIEDELVEFTNNKKELELQIHETRKEKEKLLPTLKPLIQDNTGLPLYSLKNIQIKKAKELEIIKGNIDKTWEGEDVNDEHHKLESQLNNLKEKDTTKSKKEFKSVWEEISGVFNKLKEARGKKVKDKVKNCSYEKGTKQIKKNRKLASDFINENNHDKEDNSLEEKIEELQEELLELINNKPVEKLCITLEKVKDKFKIKNKTNILKELNEHLKDETEAVEEEYERLKTFDNVTGEWDAEQLKKDETKLQVYTNTLRLLDEKLRTIEIAKKRLKGHKYNPECKFCCDNKFVLDAKEKIEEEKDTKTDHSKTKKKVEKLTSSISNQKKLCLREVSLEEKERYEKNIEELKTAIQEFNNKLELQNKMKDVETQIKNKNSKIKKLKKKLKIVKSINIVKDLIQTLDNLTGKFDSIHTQIKEDNVYNETIDGKRKILTKKLHDISEYIKNITNLDQIEKDIEKLQGEIQIKENNIEIKKENDMVKKTITLLTDLIENNNVKIINIIKGEAKLNFDLTKYKNTLDEFNKNEEKLKELNEETSTLNHFISMSHHNGIPSYLIKKITNLLQDTVNLILSEYSGMKVKIKNEGKETSIRIWNEKQENQFGQSHKNGLNAKMLCGSEKFLVELAFRISFQTLSNVSKPNFFICDEGWSCLDEKTRSNLDIILKTLLGYNEYILTVSHIDDVRKWMNKHIKIIVDDNNCRHITQ